MNENIVLVVGTIGLTVVLLIMVFFLDYRKCANRAELMGMNYNFGVLQGCMIEHSEGKWILMERYRAFEE